MIDKVIVTLKDPENGFEADFELQANVKISDLKASLSSALAQNYPNKYGYISSLEIAYKGSKLSEEETLASCGIWDGSILELLTRR